jgi:hypothetical protein
MDPLSPPPERFQTPPEHFQTPSERFQTPLDPFDLPLPPRRSNTLMPLPDESIYSSFDELYSSIQAFASMHRYGFRKGRSTTINKGPRKAILCECDRAGKLPPEKHPRNYPQDRRRSTTTRKTDCKFSLNAVQVSDTQWELRHRPDPQFAVHNHPPSHAASSHPVHRQFTQETKNKVQELQEAGEKTNVAGFACAKPVNNLQHLNPLISRLLLTRTRNKTTAH